MKKKKIIIIIVFIIIIICVIFKSKASYNQEDFIFFKLFYKENEQSNKIRIEISDKMEARQISLLQTIDNKNLIKEKIKPGTKGDFKIEITTNKDMNYQILFESKNEKPENLVFYLDDLKQYEKLEYLQEKLKGEILKGETKEIQVNWEWKYENKDDLQDTKDGEKLKKYNFLIYTIGT